MNTTDRYYAACCQTDFPSPTSRSEIKSRVDRMLEMVDFDGRILSQAEPGPGERIVVAPIDLATLRAARQRRSGHHMLSHLRTELYRGYSAPIYPRAASTKNWPLSIEGNKQTIDAAKKARSAKLELL